jgi:mono/diheme cytochrome c family protein
MTDGAATRRQEHEPLNRRCRAARQSIRGVAGVAGLVAVLLAAIAQAAIKLPPGPHRDLVYGKCRTCHDLGYLKSSMGITKAQWRDVLSSMEGFGLEVTSKQKQQLLSYLGTYLGPNPPKTTAKSNANQASDSEKLSGKEVFLQQCSGCHQSNGQGQAGQIPPLAGNEDLFRSREFPLYVILNGLKGKITVHGTAYDNQMPSFNFLTNDKIAAVVKYVRHSWGNQSKRPKGMSSITSADVAKIRQKSLTPTQVHAYRAKHSGT